MDITRREFAAALTGMAGAATLRGDALRSPATDPCHLPAPIQALTPKTSASRRSRTRSAAPASPRRSDSWRHRASAPS